MTRSKSPSLAISRNPVPPSPAPRLLFLVFVNEARRPHYRTCCWLSSCSLRSTTTCLVSFLPSSFKNPRPPGFPGSLALSQARKIIYPSRVFCQYLFSVFSCFFSESGAPAVGLTGGTVFNLSHLTFSVNSQLHLFFNFF